MSTPLSAVELTPRSELVVPKTDVSRARFPVIDAHNHLPLTALAERGIDPSRIIDEMDTLNVRTIVNLSGGTGDVLRRHIQALDNMYPGRYCTFCNVDWAGVGSSGWLDGALRGLERDAAAGARGLKVFKNLGLSVRDTSNTLLMPDDPRIAPVWDKAAQLGLPVLIHSADPVAFFRPLDGSNERWDELQNHPEWHFAGPEFPSFIETIESLYATIEAHPDTTFITAHVGCYPENLAYVSRMLDRYPNMYTDISARIAELGRAPYSARRWFLRYPDRILFGTDNTPRAPMYKTYFCFLETADEYMAYSADARIPPQGRWRIYGLYLPDGVLRRVYHENAQRLLGLA